MEMSVNRRQHKRRIFKRMRHQLVYCPFGGSVEGLQRLYRELNEALTGLIDRKDQRV